MSKIILRGWILILLAGFWFQSCDSKSDSQLTIYQSSAEGGNWKELSTNASLDATIQIHIDTTQTYQTLLGFGGAFTESTAYLLQQMSEAKRNEIIQAYFSDTAANYSFTRTHINSCDFSLSNYEYTTLPGDTSLSTFSIEEDMDDVVPMIKLAQSVSSEGFKILASPWTAPPWMKDNEDWVGGKLLPEYYSTWAKYFSRYIEEYQKQGIEMWGVTVENEPLGNGNNWESMHYSAQEMVEFVSGYLGPELNKSYPDVKILGYDQNRGEELIEWTDVMYKDEDSRKYFDGIAVHWYASTFDYFPESLDHAHQKAPEKHLIQTEACVDAEIPHWRNDAWYWSKEATDWGWDWAPAEDKKYHPKYVPVVRYARDIIGCLNHSVEGWIDWNMVLDKQGGPNWFKNWCVAPVIVDPESDEVYYTPLYYVMKHFSQYIRPNAKRIHWTSNSDELMITAAKNADGSLVVVLLNTDQEAKSIEITIGNTAHKLEISGQAIQTLRML